MQQQPPFQPVTILRANAAADLPEVGIKQGNTFYLVRDGQSNCFHVVKWDRIRWVCSCEKGACAHKLAVNDFVFEQSQKRRITGDDLATHIEDDSGLNR